MKNTLILVVIMAMYAIFWYLVYIIANYLLYK